MATNKIYLGNQLISNGYPESQKWVKPSDWLNLPDISNSQGFVGLHTVYELGSNFIAFTVSGAFTVDWGDGTTEDFASGTTVYKNLSWSSYNSSSLSSRGYRQAIIKVTPQSGENITSINLHVKHNQSNLPNNYATGWLDLTVNGPNLTTLTISAGTTVVRHRYLERAQLLNIGTVSTFANLFLGCTKLQSLTFGNTSSVTNTSSMFSNCLSLPTIPLFDTSNVTTMNGMFLAAFRLTNLPKLNTSKVQNMGNMFNGCYFLKSVPLFDTSSVTDMSGMFGACVSLVEVPLFDTSKVTTMSGMFNIAYSLQTVPLFNTSAVTNMSNMFRNCVGLLEVPLFNTSAVTTMATMFELASSIESVPDFDTTSVTTMNGMFLNCITLTRVKFTKTSALQNIGSIVNGCSNLTTFEISNAAAITTTTTAFSSCLNLTRVILPNINVSFSVATTKLSAEALDEIYTNLSATGSGKTVTVTSNWGTATDNTAIATAKGWGVSG